MFLRRMPSRTFMLCSLTYTIAGVPSAFVSDDQVFIRMPPKRSSSSMPAEMPSSARGKRAANARAAARQPEKKCSAAVHSGGGGVRAQYSVHSVSVTVPSPSPLVPSKPSTSAWRTCSGVLSPDLTSGCSAVL